MHMKAEERKQAILDCAKKLFSKKGYYQTHISDIIKEAQIARGTIYQYFDNKDDIFITLMENYYNLWERTISFERANIDLNDISAKDFLRHRVEQTLHFFSQDEDLCNLALRVGLGLPDNVSMLSNRMEKKIIDLVSQDLQFGKDVNTVRGSLSVDTAANVFTGALLRTAHYYFVVKKKKKGYSVKEIEKISNEITEIFTSGILTRREDNNE